MSQKREYQKMSPREKEKLSKQLAGLLFLHRYAKIWCGNKCTLDQIIQRCGEGTSLCSNALSAWLKWKSTLPCKKVNRSEYWIKWYGAELGVIFAPFLNCRCCPDSVKDASRIYLNAVKQLYWETGLTDADGICRLTRNDWEKLENATTALFFREWLGTQPQMRQSILGFAKAPFGQPIPEEELFKYDINGTQFLDLRYKALVNAYNDLNIMLKMGKIQQEQETNQNLLGIEKTNNGYQIPYTQLCAMEFIAESKLYPVQEKDRFRGRDTSCFRIFKFISQRKKALHTPSDKYSYTKIATACIDYSAVLNRIAQCGQPSDTGKINDAKRYVIGSMMAMELEEAFRLHLASAVASIPQSKKRKGQLTDCQKHESTIAYCILGRIPCTIVPVDTWCNNFDQWQLDSVSTHNILNYGTDLEYIYSAPLNDSEIYIDKTILLKMEQIDLIVILKGLFANQIQQEWTDSDFHSVAQFLRLEYNIIDALRKIKFPSIDDTEITRVQQIEHYKAMQMFYEMMQSWEKDGVNHSYRYYRQAVEPRRKNK